MKLTVYFRNREGERLHGTAELTKGKVVFTGKLLAHEGSTILEPKTLAPVTQSDGERYLIAFAHQLGRNVYLRLEFETDVAKAKPAPVVSAGGRELDVAALVAGIDRAVMDQYEGMTLDDVRSRIAEKEAERIAREVRA